MLAREVSYEKHRARIKERASSNSIFESNNRLIGYSVEFVAVVSVVCYSFSGMLPLSRTMCSLWTSVGGSACHFHISRLHVAC